MRTPAQIEDDIRKMVRKLDGPYYVERSRLAYLVSKEEWDELIKHQNDLTLWLGSKVETPISKMTLLGVEIIKRMT